MRNPDLGIDPGIENNIFSGVFSSTSGTSPFLWVSDMDDNV